VSLIHSPGFTALFARPVDPCECGGVAREQLLSHRVIERRPQHVVSYESSVNSHHNESLELGVRPGELMEQLKCLRIRRDAKLFTQRSNTNPVLTAYQLLFVL
jgi:hypothetical protein